LTPIFNPDDIFKDISH